MKNPICSFNWSAHRRLCMWVFVCARNMIHFKSIGWQVSFRATLGFLCRKEVEQESDCCLAMTSGSDFMTQKTSFLFLFNFFHSLNILKPSGLKWGVKPSLHAEVLEPAFKLLQKRLPMFQRRTGSSLLCMSQTIIQIHFDSSCWYSWNIVRWKELKALTFFKFSYVTTTIFTGFSSLCMVHCYNMNTTLWSKQFHCISVCLGLLSWCNINLYPSVKSFAGFISLSFRIALYSFVFIFSSDHFICPCWWQTPPQHLLHTRVIFRVICTASTMTATSYFSCLLCFLNVWKMANHFSLDFLSVKAFSSAIH